MAVTPDGSKVYVVNKYSNTVSVIDTATNTVSANGGPARLHPISPSSTTAGGGAAGVMHYSD